MYLKYFQRDKFILKILGNTHQKYDYTNLLFLLITLLAFLFLYAMIHELSISEKEARNFFENQGIFFYFIRWISGVFGQNDYVLKIPVLILHFVNLWILYAICRRTFKKKKDSLYVVVIYLLLPGANINALLFSQGVWISTLTLIIGYLYTRFHHFPPLALLILSLLDSGAILILTGIAIHSLINKDYKLIITCSLCILINYYIHPFDISGRPQAYFLQTLGQISMLYSPILFVYYMYSIYWGIKRIKALAYIGSSSIFSCFLLSLRQDIDLYTLMPQSLIALPIMIECFFSQMRTRLPCFRKPYYLFASLSLLLLFIQTSIIFGNKFTYFFSQNPNFASNYYFTKELIEALKQKGIQSITPPLNMKYQFRFYNIPENPHLKLIQVTKHAKSDIHISYNKKEILYYRILSQETPHTPSKMGK